MLAFVSSTDKETHTTPSNAQAWRLSRSTCNSGGSSFYEVYRKTRNLTLLDGTPTAGGLVMTVTDVADSGADLESLLLRLGCCTTQPTS